MPLPTTSTEPCKRRPNDQLANLRAKRRTTVTRHTAHRSPLLVAVIATSLLAACGNDHADVRPSVETSPAASKVPAEPAPSSGTPTTSPIGQRYVDAVNNESLDELVESFARDGVVVDVSRRIAGHDAIRTWAEREVIGGTLTVLDIAEQRADGQRLLVHWAPAGSDGWNAYYDFTYPGDRITVVDLQYA